MTRYAAFLRGIAPMNPNMRQDKLIGVCEQLGLRNVSAVASSGNLVFDADTRARRRLETTMEAAWQQHLGFASTTILRTLAELEALRDLAPFAGIEHGRRSYTLVTFAKSPVHLTMELPHHDTGQAWTLAGATDRELFTVTDSTHESNPDVMRWLEREFGKGLTSRTWPAVLRVLDRCAG